MKINYIKKYGTATALLIMGNLYSAPVKPKLTAIIVVDQFAHHYFLKLSSHFKHGLKFFTKNGVVYSNAYMPHGIPTTATGHTGLNTGAFAKDHGIIGNAWCSQDGKKIACILCLP